MIPDDSPAFHDLTGRYGCSLLPVAGEMRRREAKRAARAARWQSLGLRKAIGRLRNVLRRRDRAPELCGCDVCMELDGAGLELLSPLELDSVRALMLSRTVAERDGELALRDALHHLLILHVVPGELEGVLPLLARPSNAIKRAIDAPGKDVN